MGCCVVLLVRAVPGFRNTWTGFSRFGNKLPETPNGINPRLVLEEWTDASGTKQRRLRLSDLPGKPRGGTGDFNRYSNTCVLDEWDGPRSTDFWQDKNNNTINDCYERHGRGSNLLMSDGRVYWCKGYDFSTGSGF